MPWARRTARCANVLRVVALALGSRPAARLLRQLSIAVSPSTLLRVLRQVSDPAAAPPRVIGVDDFAVRKGQSYGTLIVDLETHRPLDLLPDRAAATLAAWLRKHPSIALISRDRSPEYARGAGLGAPQARQIADRFHLVKNVREALERLLDRNRSRLSGIAVPAIVDPTIPVAASHPAPRRPAPRSPAEATARAASREQRQTRVAQVRALRGQGVSGRRIARALTMSRCAVSRYLRSDSDPTVRLVRPKPSMLDPYLPYLHERWQAGCENGLQLWRELREQGYPGSKKMVAVWVAQQRSQPAKTAPHKHHGGREAAPADAPAEPAAHRARRPASSRTLSFFLLRDPSSFNAQERGVVQQMQGQCPDVAGGYPLFQGFLEMMRTRSARDLESWLSRARASGLADVENFAAGVERDKEAVAGGLTEEWSNGQLEGHVHRLKLLKRTMYGRANFDLLRRRVLTPE